DETYKSVAVEGTDKNAGFQKCRAHPAHGFQVLAVVREAPILSDGSFVVYLPDSIDERIIKRNLSNRDSFFFSLLRLVSRFESDLLCPPVIERRNRQNCQIVHLEGIRKFRRV